MKKNATNYVFSQSTNRCISVYPFEAHNFDKSPDNVYATALSARYSVTS